MFTEEQLSELEQEELETTEEAIAVMATLLGTTKVDLEKELRSFYQKYGKDGVVTYNEAKKWVSEKDHRKRWVVLFLTFSDIFQTTRNGLENEFRSFLTEVIGLEEHLFKSKVDLEKILNTKWGEDELNWLSRLDDDIDLWLSRIQNDVKIGILKRQSLDEILEKLDKRFESMNKVLYSLGITESTAVGSIARKELFKNFNIKKYKFFSRVDERRCEYCGALHGTVFPISAYEVGVTASPIHPRCRCWEVPITD